MLKLKELLPASKKDLRVALMRAEVAEAEAKRERVAKEELYRKYNGRLRVGHKPFNIINLTSALRGQVDTSLKIEQDDENIYVTSKRPLTSAQVHKVESLLGFELNKT